MKKIYKVPLYEVNYDFINIGKLSYVDTILVEKSINGIKELVTNYDEIDLIHHLFMKKERLDYISRKPIKAEEIGHHLVVFSEDLDEKHIAELDDYINYLNGYDESKWNMIYQELPILTKQEKRQLKRREYKRIGR